MTLIQFAVIVVVGGLIFWLIENYVPMSPPFKTVLRVVAVVILILLVLALFGVMNLPFRVS